jgi:tetratricopeptide (TPR) repeat protein
LNSATVEQKMKAEYFLQEISKRREDYYQEAMVGLIYIKSQRGKAAVLNLIETLLDSDPELTNGYYYNVYIDRKFYSWPELLPMCEKIYSTNKDNQLMITFYAYCLVRAHRYELAQKFIQKAILIDSSNVLIKTVHAYIAGFINLRDQSVLILGDAIQSNFDMKYMLPYILQAQFCEENKDWECAVQNWRLVLKNTPNSISSLGGLAYAKYNQGHYGEARVYMERGFDIDDRGLYSRLLFVEKMLQEIENKGLQ